MESTKDTIAILQMENCKLKKENDSLNELVKWIKLILLSKLDE